MFSTTAVKKDFVSFITPQHFCCENWWFILNKTYEISRSLINNNHILRSFRNLFSLLCFKSCFSKFQIRTFYCLFCLFVLRLRDDKSTRTTIMTWLWRMQQLNFLFNIFFQKSISIGICSRSSSSYFPVDAEQRILATLVTLYFVWENLVYLLYWLWCIKASLLRLCSRHHESWHHHLCYKTPPSHPHTVLKPKITSKNYFMEFHPTPMFQSSPHPLLFHRSRVQWKSSEAHPTQLLYLKAR